MEPDSLTIGPLRISTMVVTAHLGTSINLLKLLEIFHEKAIPLTWPGEGFLKVEYKPILLLKPNATPQEEQKAKQKAKAEVNRRLRNRDAIPEQRPAKPLLGQRSLFDE